MQTQTALRHLFRPQLPPSGRVTPVGVQRGSVGGASLRSIQTGSSSDMQRLYETAFDAFRGGRAASREDLERVKEAVHAVSLEELGMEPPDEVQASNSRPLAIEAFLKSARGRFKQQSDKIQSITYLHVYENSDFSVGIFCLPERARIPLHNHPGMNVISRVLYGKLHVRSFDWITPQPAIPLDKAQEARLYVDKVVEAGEMPSMLHATSCGNIHAFTAIKDCAVLDVLAPPYLPSDPRRDCTYFKEVAQGNTIILEPYTPPVNFKIARGKYRGVALGAFAAAH